MKKGEELPEAPVTKGERREQKRRSRRKMVVHGRMTSILNAIRKAAGMAMPKKEK